MTTSPLTPEAIVKADFLRHLRSVVEAKGRIQFTLAVYFDAFAWGDFKGDPYEVFMRVWPYTKVLDGGLGLVVERDRVIAASTFYALLEFARLEGLVVEEINLDHQTITMRSKLAGE